MSEEDFNDESTVLDETTIVDTLQGTTAKQLLKDYRELTKQWFTAATALKKANKENYYLSLLDVLDNFSPHDYRNLPKFLRSKLRYCLKNLPVKLIIADKITWYVPKLKLISFAKKRKYTKYFARRYPRRNYGRSYRRSTYRRSYRRSYSRYPRRRSYRRSNYRRRY